MSAQTQASREGRRPAARLLALAAAIVCTLTGCGIQIPTDPLGTLDRIRDSGRLRAGASPAGEAVLVSDGEVAGPAAEAVEGFARSEGARVEWTVASEELLVDALENGEIDLAVGGMTVDTPWTERVSVTRGYPALSGGTGAELVVMLPLGENALQVALETYLDREVGR